MEASEEKSQLDKEQPYGGLGFQSDIAEPPINDDKLTQILTQELENVAICCSDETLNRDFPGHYVVPNEESEVRRVIDEEVYNLVVKEAVDEVSPVVSSSEGGERKYQDVRRFVGEAVERHGVKILPEGSVECGVSEEREVGVNGLGHEKEVNEIDDHDDEKVLEHKEDDLKGKHEFEIEGEHGGSENLETEYIGEKQSENGEELENESETAGGGEGEGGSVAVLDDDRQKRYHYTLRPDAEDCSYYMRTGMCKFGSNCKFNHHPRRRTQPSTETVKQREEDSERSGQTECKFYQSSGGCKYGKACKYNHSKGRTAVTPVLEYNFLGLPIRLGEKECPYYMRNGSCKYGPNCRFNHPDPSAVGGVAATYENGLAVHLQGAPQATMPSWSAPRAPNDTAPFIPVLYSPTHSMPPPNPDWNGYQAPAPAYPTSERSLPTPPAFFMDNPPSDTNVYTHQQQQMLVSDFPERPGQLACSYFMKTGDCKYRSACKFHHPKSRIPMPTLSVLSNKGLPLRPDQNICTHYRRYGICKYGPACKYDHPVNYSNSLSTARYRPDGFDEYLT